MTVPIDTRNVGISSADPKNSMRSMNSPSLGTMRFSARPQKKAPTMPSMPTHLGDDAGRQQGGEHEGVAQGARLADAAEEPPGDGGRTPNVKPTRMARPSTTCRISSMPLASPVVEPEMKARMTSASVSVSTVAPTVAATARLAARPMLRTIG